MLGERHVVRQSGSRKWNLDVVVQLVGCADHAEVHVRRGGAVVEEQELAGLEWQQVDVVAARRSGGPVLVAALPAVDVERLRGEERALHVPGEVEIALEGALLDGGQAAETRADQRIGGDPIGLDRLAAHVADAERVPFDARERLVHLFEQPRERLRLGRAGDDRFEPAAALQKLVAGLRGRVERDDGFHGHLLRRNYPGHRSAAIRFLWSNPPAGAAGV